MAKTKVITNQASKDELEEDIKDVEEIDEEELEEAEDDKIEDDEEEEIEDDDENLDDEEEEDDQEEEEDLDDDEEEEEDPKDKKSKKKDDVDYKKKYSESTREAQIQASRVKSLAQAHDEAAQVPEPTEDQLRAEYPEWDDLDDFQKKMAKRDLHKEWKLQKYEDASKRIKDEQTHIDKIGEFVADPDMLDKFPKLKNPRIAEEFTKFAGKPSRFGADLEDVAKSFLFDLPPDKKKKGSLFQSSSRGNGKETRSSGYTPEQVEKIRKTNQRLYQRLIKEKKIRIVI